MSSVGALRSGPRFVILAACAVAAGEVWLAAAAQAPPRRAAVVQPAVAQNVLDTLAAYAAGDDLAVERWLQTADGAANVSAVPHVLGGDRPWARSTAAFFLEVAVAQRGRGRATLTAGLAMVTSRPAPFGENDVDDRFEMLWHQTALGVLQGLRDYTGQGSYLDRLAARLGEGGTRALPDRLPLARAIVAEGRCCRVHAAPILAERFTLSPTITRFVSSPVNGPTRLQAAVDLFDRAAQIPALRVEALIRGGVLLQEAGRQTDALAWFEKVPAHSDSRLGYVQHLSHGRALDVLNRPADAAAAYRSAIAFVPNAQWAGIGLATALLRAGQPDEAGRAAGEARRMVDGISDTERISEYQQADSRFVPEWLAELRRLRR